MPAFERTVENGFLRETPGPRGPGSFRVAPQVRDRQPKRCRNDFRPCGVSYRMEAPMSYRVLIVDDDDLARLPLERALGAAGFETLAATSGTEALDLVVRE